MSIQTQIDRISGNVSAALAAVAEKGVTVPDGSNSDALAELIASIEAGGGGDDSIFKDIIERTAVNPTLPSDLTKIGNFAFYYYSSLELTSLPAGVTSIGNYAFSNCSNLALTSLPAGVTSIGANAFYYCSKLALTSLPAGVTSIDSYAFFNCKGLTTITFEGKPSSIATNVFNSCTNLTTINVPWAEGAVTDAPWGATKATINYNYTGE